MDTDDKIEEAPPKWDRQDAPPNAVIAILTIDQEELVTTATLAPYPTTQPCVRNPI